MEGQIPLCNEKTADISSISPSHTKICGLPGRDSGYKYKFKTIFKAKTEQDKGETTVLLHLCN